MQRFGLGQPVRRSEDPRLLTGRGRYAADVRLPGEARAVVLRSPHAHARIRAIDTTRALAMPGVLAVLTGADVAADGLGEVPCSIRVNGRDGQRMPRPGRPLLAAERVRYVGDGVALVVAETLATAVDAAERIDVDYDPLPAVATIEAAVADGAPPVWDAVPDNRAFFWQRGDGDAVAAALAGADRIVSLALANNRVVPCAMEPRAAVGAFDAATGRYTLYTSSQSPHGVKKGLSAHTLNVPEEMVHVIVGDVGGGFGTKIFHYPEEALVLWAARRIGRPVKWVGDRSEAFLADTHGRDQRNRLTAGFTADGRLLALKVESFANMGAYLNCFGPAIPTEMTGCMLSGVYALPALHAVCEGVYTNTTPVDAYRGAGRPEASYMLERLMDAAARELGLTPDAIRRLNFITPDRMPYRTVTGPVYDSGDFGRRLDAALAKADWAGAAGRKREAAARGSLRGIGLSSYVEICGFQGEDATIRFADGGIEVLVGTQSTGQGHETAYAQIVAETLGVPFDAVTVVQGDTDRIRTGLGTSGSRSLPVGGPAVKRAAEAVIARGRGFAAHLLQADAGEVRFAEGRFETAGGRGIDLMALAEAATDPANLPPGETVAVLDATARFDLEASTFPNGCHVCEVEVDPETGRVTVVRYTVVDDFGTVVNPLLLAGQVHGGIAQGIGQALMEFTAYDPDSAQLLTASFVDYALPRAADLPAFDIAFDGIPCTTNPLGIKGAGEAGTIGACPAVINAVIDALAPLGVTHIDMPATPEAVWRTIRAAKTAA
ncbi:MAG: xanthine dehydrogenase family protein molybdopterin-binding subunit [Rhodospirillales bacterium]|nr:MAG: xanthine dehydrogenase family protein molybdopterin-binding subunit [Rhodospirillales bacterium]